MDISLLGVRAAVAWPRNSGGLVLNVCTCRPWFSMRRAGQRA